MNRKTRCPENKRRHFDWISASATIAWSTRDLLFDDTKEVTVGRRSWYLYSNKENTDEQPNAAESTCIVTGDGGGGRCERWGGAGGGVRTAGRRACFRW